MAQTNISFEMNDKLRDQMEEICEDLGMSMDDAFQIFARKMVNEQGIPFEVTEKDYPQDEKKETILKIVKIFALAAAVFAAVSAIVSVISMFKKKKETHHLF